MRRLLLKRALFTLILHPCKISFYYNINYAILPYNLTPNSSNKVLEKAGINLKVVLHLRSLLKLIA
jgi:hypothetical protein